MRRLGRGRGQSCREGGCAPLPSKPGVRWWAAASPSPLLILSIAHLLSHRLSSLGPWSSLSKHSGNLRGAQDVPQLLPQGPRGQHGKQVGGSPRVRRASGWVGREARRGLGDGTRRPRVWLSDQVPGLRQPAEQGQPWSPRRCWGSGNQLGTRHRQNCCHQQGEPALWEGFWTGAVVGGVRGPEVRKGPPLPALPALPRTSPQQPGLGTKETQG